MTLTVEIAKTFRFEAAHFLPNVGPHHKCHNTHGHSYQVTLRLKGPVDENMGWIMDLSDISEQFAPVLKTLDHAFLNKIKGLENPTSENITIWIMKTMGKIMPLLSSITLETTDRLAVTVERHEVM
jgi:6-pyruvoyltetrahydropterin/6-carboxytetrahydropterin synthase